MDTDNQRVECTMSGKYRNRSIGSGAWIGVAAVAAGAFLLGRYLRRAEAEDGAVTPAAFAQPGAAKGSFDQTRDAGPENIRDHDDDDVWDRVDEGVDESFPASDPPAHNRFD
jgi:hypothetical protein